jgi:hypothetical protein
MAPKRVTVEVGDLYFAAPSAAEVEVGDTVVLAGDLGDGAVRVSRQRDSWCERDLVVQAHKGTLATVSEVYRDPVTDSYEFVRYRVRIIPGEQFGWVHKGDTYKKGSVAAKP